MESSVADRPTSEDGLEPDTHPDFPDEPEDEAGASGIVIDGTTGQLSMSVGGKRPTAAALKMLGGKMQVEGQFEKGQSLELTVTAVVTGVAFVDTRDDKTGQVTGCERRHSAHITGVHVNEAE